ncbi:MAG: MerR family transcriptional regulator [Acholeplasmataceae bacterium]|nr:MerR family transcriptional regulator [Acholeplasmataceae bacterium]
MKMKDLKERLNEEGINITERMVRYYIEKNILPKPDYPHSNQAIYSELHYCLLKIIDTKKKQDLTLDEIAEDINEILKRESILDDDTVNWMFGKYEEEKTKTEWLKVIPNINKFFSKDELNKEIKSDHLDLAMILAEHLELLDDKEYYDTAEKHCIESICNYIQLKQRVTSANNVTTKDFLSHYLNELKRAKKLANEISDFTVKYYHSWLNTSLLQSMLLLEARKRVVKADKEECSVWQWNHLTLESLLATKEILEYDAEWELPSYWNMYNESIIEDDRIEAKDIFEYFKINNE